MRIMYIPKDQEREIPCALPYHDAQYVVPEEPIYTRQELEDAELEGREPESFERKPCTCPHCGNSPLHINSPDNDESDDRTTRGRARCTTCLQFIGNIIVYHSTLFGLREDRAVLIHGRARVY